MTSTRGTTAATAATAAPAPSASAGAGDVLEERSVNMINYHEAPDDEDMGGRRSFPRLQEEEEGGVSRCTPLQQEQGGATCSSSSTKQEREQGKNIINYEMPCGCVYSRPADFAGTPEAESPTALC